MALPGHIAIVMDGNGRWAESRNRPRSMGHQAGVRAARDIVRACGEQGIAALTLFAFSSENWRRPESEVRWLMDLFLRSLRREIDELHENRVRLRFIGDRRALSEELQSSMARVEARTAGNDGLSLNIAMNYGGRWDIANAARGVARAVAAGTLEPEDVDEEHLEPFFGLAGQAPPDLLIRTGGERRISNFLLWQLAYTELYFSDTLWPDFTREELALAIDDFGHRQRRFGRLGSQVETPAGA